MDGHSTCQIWPVDSKVRERRLSQFVLQHPTACVSLKILAFFPLPTGPPFSPFAPLTGLTLYSFRHHFPSPTPLPNLSRSPPDWDKSYLTLHFNSLSVPQASHQLWAPGSQNPCHSFLYSHHKLVMRMNVWMNEGCCASERHLSSGKFHWPSSREYALFCGN